MFKNCINFTDTRNGIRILQNVGTLRTALLIGPFEFAAYNNNAVLA